MLNRDLAHRFILDQGMILGLPWGSDPIGDGQPGSDDDDDDERECPPDERAEDGSHDTRDWQEVGQ